VSGDLAGDDRVRAGQHPIVGKYSLAGDLQIEGSAMALASLARALRQAPSVLDLGMPSNEEPAPYDGFLRQIVIRPARGKVQIERDDSILLISGDPDFRSVLAENIESLLKAGDASLSHLHVDYHPDHFYLEPTSSSLVIEVSPA
jgi:hypothetical protein